MTFVLVKITPPKKKTKKETKQWEREFIMVFAWYYCGLDVSPHAVQARKAGWSVEEGSLSQKSRELGS